MCVGGEGGEEGGGRGGREREGDGGVDIREKRGIKRGK